MAKVIINNNLVYKVSVQNVYLLLKQNLRSCHFQRYSLERFKSRKPYFVQLIVTGIRGTAIQFSLQYLRILQRQKFCSFGITASSVPGPFHSRGLQIKNKGRTTVGRTPLGKLLARRRDLYLTTHKRETYNPSVGFEPTISAGKRPQTYALERVANGNATETELLQRIFSLKSC